MKKYSFLIMRNEEIYINIADDLHAVLLTCVKPITVHKCINFVWLLIYAETECLGKCLNHALNCSEINKHMKLKIDYYFYFKM